MTHPALSVTENDHRFRDERLPLMDLLSQRLKQTLFVIEQFGLDPFW